MEKKKDEAEQEKKKREGKLSCHRSRPWDGFGYRV